MHLQLKSTVNDNLVFSAGWQTLGLAWLMRTIRAIQAIWTKLESLDPYVAG